MKPKVWGMIDKFVVRGRSRWVIRLLLHAHAVQLCSDYADNLKFVVILFRVIENCKSALSEKIDDIGLPAVSLEYDTKPFSHSPYSACSASSDSRVRVLGSNYLNLVKDCSYSKIKYLKIMSNVTNYIWHVVISKVIILLLKRVTSNE